MGIRLRSTPRPQVPDWRGANLQPSCELLACSLCVRKSCFENGDRLLLHHSIFFFFFFVFRWQKIRWLLVSSLDLGNTGIRTLCTICENWRKQWSHQTRWNEKQQRQIRHDQTKNVNPEPRTVVFVACVKSSAVDFAECIGKSELTQAGRGTQTYDAYAFSRRSAQSYCFWEVFTSPSVDRFEFSLLVMCT